MNYSLASGQTGLITLFKGSPQDVAKIRWCVHYPVFVLLMHTRRWCYTSHVNWAASTCQSWSTTKPWLTCTFKWQRLYRFFISQLQYSTIPHPICMTDTKLESHFWFWLQRTDTYIKPNIQWQHSLFEWVYNLIWTSFSEITILRLIFCYIYS